MTEDRCSLLIVDDEAYILPTLVAFLRAEFDIITAGSADEAESVLKTQSIDIVLTDQRMPRRTGIQLLEWIRLHSPRTVRLLMTGHSDIDEAVDAINRGQIYYYLLKPWRLQELLQILRNAAEKVLLERKREQLLAQLRELNRNLELRVAERTQQLEEANQLLEQRARELERLALTDPLTGLFNRRAMDELASFEFKRQQRYLGCLAVGFLDVDHFKQVNTRFSITGGDEALRSLARVLTGCVREVDSVGRIGGEEFLVLAREADVEGARVLAERIRSHVESASIVHHCQTISLTVSLGFAVAEAGIAANYADMCDLAATALCEAKSNGRNRCIIRPFTADNNNVLLTG